MKAGTDTDAVKVSAEISKAWPLVDVHLNPGFRRDLAGGTDITEINAGAYWRLSRSCRPIVEYNYIDFGSDKVSMSRTTGSGDTRTAIFDVDQDMHVVKFGLNYRF